MAHGLGAARKTLGWLEAGLVAKNSFSSFQRRLESSSCRQIAEELDPSLRWDDGSI